MAHLSKASFGEWLHEVMKDNPPLRASEFFSLHEDVLDVFRQRVSDIGEKEALASYSKDWNYKALVTHFIGWDEWATQAFVDIIIRGQKRPAIMDLKHCPIASFGDHFESVDHFNAVQVETRKAWTWHHVQTQAMFAATNLFTYLRYFVYSDSELLLLERSDPHHWETHEITLPCGWYLWAISIGHISYGHPKLYEFDM